MPRNMENASRLQKEWRERTMSCQIKVRKDSGIMEALESACESKTLSSQNISVLQLQSVCKKRGMRRDIRHLPLTTPE